MKQFHEFIKKIICIMNGSVVILKTNGLGNVLFKMEIYDLITCFKNKHVLETIAFTSLLNRIMNYEMFSIMFCFLIVYVTDPIKTNYSRHKKTGMMKFWKNTVFIVRIISKRKIKFSLDFEIRRILS